MRYYLPPASRLSRITIDTDKNWNAKSISNVNNLTANNMIQAVGYKTANLYLAQATSSCFALRDYNDTSYTELCCSNIRPYGGIMYQLANAYLYAQSMNNSYVSLKSYKNDTGLTTIAQLQSSTNPTFDLYAGCLVNPLNCNSQYLQNYKLQPGDVEWYVDNTDYHTSSTSYVLLCQARVFCNALLRVKFSLWNNQNGYTAYGRVYKNGTPFGTERSVTSTNSVTFTEDLEFTKNDLIQIYGYTNYDGSECHVSYFKCCVAEVMGIVKV